MVVALIGDAVDDDVGPDRRLFFSSPGLVLLVMRLFLVLEARGFSLNPRIGDSLLSLHPRIGDSLLSLHPRIGDSFGDLIGDLP
jgi:hypothetical protein